MEKQYQNSLQEMECVIKNIKTLRAWQDLEEQEYKQNGIIPWPSDSIKGEVKIEIGRFWQLAFDLEDRLKHAPARTCKSMQHKFLKLFMQFQELI